jgi:glycine cleavage system H protein
LFLYRSTAVKDEARGSRRFVMEFPEGLKYSKEHEWVLVEGNTATIGITEFAQEELGDIVYVELPEVGEKVVKDDPFGAVESVKAVSDIYAPVSGSVLEINDVLPDNPETINDDPYGDGWMIRVELSDKDDLTDLMDAEEYAEYVQQQKENDEEEDEDEEEEEVDEEEEDKDK